MYKFDVEKNTEALISWIREWFNENGKGCKAVLGISGGKDSTVAAALCVKALGAERVVGVMLPNGIQKDIDDSLAVCEFLNIDNYTINIGPALEESLKRIENCGLTITEQCRQNIAPRERTKIIRAVCQCVNGRMINTCNLSEDYIGYFTIGGDGEGDVAPLGKLTKSEVCEIGHFLGLPRELVDKAPSDGLCGKTDEDNIGFTYKVLDDYIRLGSSGDDEVDKLIRIKHKANAFKLEHVKSYIPSIEGE